MTARQKAMFRSPVMWTAVVVLIVSLVMLLKTGPGIRDDIPPELVAGALIAGSVIGFTWHAYRIATGKVRLSARAMRRNKSNVPIPVAFAVALLIIALFAWFIAAAIRTDLDAETHPLHYVRGRLLIDILFIHRSNILDALVKLPVFAGILSLLSSLFAMVCVGGLVVLRQANQPPSS